MICKKCKKNKAIIRIKVGKARGRACGDCAYEMSYLPKMKKAVFTLPKGKELDQFDLLCLTTTEKRRRSTAHYVKKKSKKVKHTTTNTVKFAFGVCPI